MAFDTLVLPLQRLEIFQGLSSLQLTEIARRAERIVYRPGSVILDQNALCDASILIISGDALRVAGADHGGRPEPVAPGSLLAEMAMLIEVQPSSTVVARTAVRALRISRDVMLELMLEDRALTEQLTATITGRLTVLAEDLREIDNRITAPDNLLHGQGVMVSIPPPHISLHPTLH